MPYYAISYPIKTIVETWSACKALVSGVKGVCFKSFTTINEAEAFLIDKFDDLKEGLGKDTLTKYTRWLNEHTQDERENVAKEQIKLLLYNEKDMVIELRKKQSKNGSLESCILSIHSNVH